MISRDISYIADERCELRETHKLRRDVREYVAARPKTEKGHARFTYAEAVGLQHLQLRLQNATRLTLITQEGERDVRRLTDWAAPLLRAPAYSSEYA